MSLCKQTELPNFIEEIKIDSESIIESEAWSIINLEKLNRCPLLPDWDVQLHVFPQIVASYVSFMGELSHEKQGSKGFFYVYSQII